ncbi:MAG: serine/threonine protein kinase [Myxococcales bacterium]|nr:serine/threonine protein kinase [Myxococcales bacterium]
MSASDLIGKNVGNFRVTGFVDAGAMGAVYSGEHAMLGHKVAIKVMKATLRKSPHADQAIRRFTAEAKALTRISQAPNIIKLHDFGQMEDGQLYYVMEFLEGKDLDTVIAEDAPMSPEAAMPYLEQICAGLQAAHDANVVHRDLKPGNVFVLRGEGLHIKLLDFGIAKRLDTVSKLTSVGMGSPIYAAPEQVKAEVERVSPATDIYSLAVLAYELVSGRLPYDIPDGLHPYAALMYPFDHDHVPLIERVPGFNAAISQLVDRCLARDPEKRPQSALEFIEAWAAALGLEAPVLPKSTPTIMSERPNTAALDDTVPLKLAMLRKGKRTTLGLATGQSIPHLPRKRRWPLAALGALMLVGAGVAALIYVAMQNDGDREVRRRPQHVASAASGQALGSAKPAPRVTPMPRQVRIEIKPELAGAACKLRLGERELDPIPAKLTIKPGGPRRVVVSCEGHVSLAREIGEKDEVVVLEPRALPVKPAAKLRRKARAKAVAKSKSRSKTKTKAKVKAKTKAVKKTYDDTEVPVR